MKLPRVTFAVAVQCLSLAMCVLGRPQPSSSLSLDETSSSPLLGFHEVPDRRLLRGGGRGGGSGGGSGGRRSGFSGGGGRSGGIIGGGGGSTTFKIIAVTVSVTFLILLVAFLVWRSHNKKKNPNWSSGNCFIRNKPAAEKLSTSVKRDDEHQIAVVDVPRLDHTGKSRKQASPSQDFKNSTSLK